jgi:hypothetical protein
LKFFPMHGTNYFPYPPHFPHRIPPVGPLRFFLRYFFAVVALLEVCH